MFDAAGLRVAFVGLTVATVVALAAVASLFSTRVYGVPDTCPR